MQTWQSLFIYMNTSRHICTNKKRIFDTMFWLTFSNRFGCLGNVIRNYKDFPLFSECSTDISIKGNTIYFSFYTWKILDILKNFFLLRNNCIFELNFFFKVNIVMTMRLLAMLRKRTVDIGECTEQMCLSSFNFQHQSSYRHRNL